MFRFDGKNIVRKRYRFSLADTPERKFTLQN